MTNTKHAGARSIGVAPLGLLFAVALTAAIRHYWIARALGTAGANGMALYAFVLPASILVFWIVGMLAWRIAVRSGRDSHIVWTAVIFAMATVLVLALCFEAWRTNNLPSGSESGVRVVYGVLA
jgi:hypothetical protein